MEWSGNLTLRMGETEDTFSPGSIEVEEYGENSISLKISSQEGKGEATVRMSKEEYKELVKELVQKL